MKLLEMVFQKHHSSVILCNMKLNHCNINNVKIFVLLLMYKV